MEEKNLHAGHRQRLKERFLGEGLSGFEKHNVLEIVLFYAIPRKDTNPIAHKLIKRFGSVRGVLDASVEELCKVDGISEHAATLIKLFSAVNRYAAGEIVPAERYDSLNKLGNLMVHCYAGLTVETIKLVLMDADSHILDIVTLGEGSVNQVRMDTRKLIEHAIRTNASMAVLAHNHPGGMLTASSEDIVVTEAVAKALETIGVHFIDHLLIAGNRFDAIWSKNQGIFYQNPPRSMYTTADGEIEIE